MKISGISFIIVLIITGFIIYSNSINGEFIMDDNVLVWDNIHIKDISMINIINILRKNIPAEAGKEYKFYRPFQMFTYMIDYSLWKLDVRGYHITNILFHILTALALYCLINIIYHDRLLSSLTSILFLAHPIHTEAVAYISGRADPLSTVFVLTCLVIYIKRLQSNNLYMYILLVISCLSALLSRENTVVLPLLLILYHYIFKKKIKFIDFTSILILALSYIIIRLTILKQFAPHLVSATTMPQRLPGFFSAIYNYFKIILLPLHLHMEYGNKLFRFTDPRSIAGLAILISLLIYPLIKKDRLFSFSIYWFLLALLPVSNIYPLNAYMAEHWLYMPSIGFFLILSAAICKAVRYRAFKTSIIIILTALYSYLTIRQNNYWINPVSFFERTLKYAPESAMPYNNLGIIYDKAGEKEKAVAFLKRAAEIAPDNSKAYNNLGNVYYSISKNKEAIAYYKKAIELDPGYVKAYFNLGNIYKSMGKTEEAIESYRKALEIDPGYIDGYNNLGVVYRTIGKNEEAIGLYKEALEINPDYASAHNNLSAAYYYNKEYNLAIKHCDTAIELGYNVSPDLSNALKPHRK